MPAKSQPPKEASDRSEPERYLENSPQAREPVQGVSRYKADQEFTLDRPYAVGDWIEPEILTDSIKADLLRNEWIIPVTQEQK